MIPKIYLKIARLKSSPSYNVQLRFLQSNLMSLKFSGLKSTFFDQKTILVPFFHLKINLFHTQIMIFSKKQYKTKF